jgi:Lamin Tail Domain/CotH kinase protein
MHKAESNMTSDSRFLLLAVALGLILSVSVQAVPPVVINELHTNPDLDTELVEFVELYNSGAADIDLSGWHFSEGVFYTFPDGAVLPAGDHVIVAQDPLHIQAKWSSGRYALSEDAVFGPFAGKLANEGERIVLRNADGAIADEVAYQLGFPWPTVGDPVPTDRPGEGASMQLVNPAFDNDLAGSWRSALPTPTAANARGMVDNIGPHIRQVGHSPKQPDSGEVVTITAKVTDPDGVQSVVLQYQLVDPGHYIRYQRSDGNNRRYLDAEYRENWISIPMVDDGTAGDERAGDDVYTALMPESLQTHRRLVRYCITVQDSAGAFLKVPYNDDPQPNFAYFVYDDVPAWSGAIRPGSSNTAQAQVVTYAADVMQSLPVYHLLAKKEDIEDCQFNPIPDARCDEEAAWYQWTGTLVYDGVVYDHIWYRPRGGWATYAFGKNRWKFDFNRGHYFQGHDDRGNAYETKWDKLNFSACFQFNNTHNRGEHGMYEAVTTKLMDLAGVPSCYMNWLHFRVIDEARESGSSQYEGDFWGLYLAIEQPDGRFLKARDLPDGNLYKMYFACNGSTGNKNNQGPTQVTDHSDVIAFCSAYQGYPSDRQWWEENTNLDLYYSYRTICDAVHHYDLTDRWNCLYYAHPQTGRWWMIPWDFDHSWDTGIFTHDDEYWKQVLDPRFFQGHSVANPSRYHRFPDCIIAFQNRVRELSDLLVNADQCGQIIDECAAVISDPEGGPSFVQADRAMWDRHPRNTNPGTYYQNSPTRDFAGMVQRMREFIGPGGWGAGNLARIDDDTAIPNTPLVASRSPAGFPADALVFAVGDFDDPQGRGTFGAMKWRVAEVSPVAQADRPDWGVVLVPDAAEWKYQEGRQEPSVPSDAWRQLTFDDSAWSVGHTAIGYGEAFIATELSDMRGGYSTFYLRRTFDVMNMAELEDLVLDVKYDDGVNVWINEQLVYQDNVSSAELAHDATANSAIENVSFVRYDLGDPSTLLVEGTNVIAVQVLNQSVSGSSDCFVDVRLTAQHAQEPSDEAPPSSSEGWGKYEIDAVWESEELAEFSDSIRIPASVVQPGRTYRVRCRMSDTTGRWSHWSVPVQFTAGDPVAAGILTELRITELMYNPPEAPDGRATDNNEYEFIELKNVGDQTLDLSTVSLTDGVTFDFADGDVTTLGPGQFVLVVRDETAFLSRYGADLAPLVAGEYAGKLANGGETVKLVDFWAGTIAEFQYSDGSDWPIKADGAGHSLVLIDPEMLTEPVGSLNEGGSWRASTHIDGSPGADDPEAEMAQVNGTVTAPTLAMSQ